MEFHETLQHLRKQKGLTQEELAAALYVSRTAVSKWESGRGYPNIDSLKHLAAYFGITVDDLLSGAQVLTIAEEDRKQKAMHTRDLIFGLLDLSCLAFFFLPFFSQTKDGIVSTASLLSLTELTVPLHAAYGSIVAGLSLWGILTLALQNYSAVNWKRSAQTVSLLLSICGTVLFIISPQPYAAFVLFIFLLVKLALLRKQQ